MLGLDMVYEQYTLHEIRNSWEQAKQVYRNWNGNQLWKKLGLEDLGLR